MTPSVFRYSRTKVFSYSLPLVLIGLAMSLASDDVWPRVGGLLGSVFFMFVIVIALRSRLEVDSDGLRIRQLSRTHTVRWGTIGHQQVSSLIGSSSVLTMTDEQGRKRAFSLEFFTRSQREMLANAMRAGALGSGRGRPDRK